MNLSSASETSGAVTCAVRFTGSPQTSVPRIVPEETSMVSVPLSTCLVFESTCSTSQTPDHRARRFRSSLPVETVALGAGLADDVATAGAFGVAEGGVAVLAA